MRLLGYTTVELFLAVREYELPTWDRHMTGLLATWPYLLYTK